MRSKNHRARRTATLAAVAASLTLPHSMGAETVDDAFLLTTSVSPNVLLIFDNSYRMNEIEWHPAFDPDVASTCAAFNPSTVYVADVSPEIDDNNETYCGNTRKIFNPSSPTLYDGRYLNWYFSDAADPYINEIETAKASQIGCNKAGGAKKFMELYRRTRNEAARHVLIDVLCLAEPKGLRFGMASFRTPADGPGVDPNGGYVAIAVDRNQPTHAANMEAHISNLKNDNWAPISEAIFQLYTYLMPRVATDLPYGKDGTTRFPLYSYDNQGNYDAGSGMMIDPVQYACQKNFIILVTGGESSRDDFDQDPNSTSQGFGNFATLIGDYYADGEDEEPPSGATNEETYYLDDIAKYMQDNDLRPDFADDQAVDFYAIGFGTTPTYDAYLQRAADLGDGLFYHAKDGEQLSQALVAALNDIVEKARSFTAATVPSARTADGGDFYNSFFLPNDNTAFWQGHLRAWHFTAAGEIVDRDGHCALVDPDGGGECNGGPFQKTCQTGETWPACVRPFWDAGEEIPVPGDDNAAGGRQLFTSKLNTAVPPVPVRTDLDQNLSAADMKISTFAAPPNPAPNSAQYLAQGSVATNAEGLADEVVMYARGCFFGTGAATNVSVVHPCDPRPWLLGDIFHSDPIVVRNPPNRQLGSAYDAFRAAYLDRDRVIYTGTNGGFLEGFHVGTWNTSTELYNEGTGVEKFGFMPWEPRTKIKRKPVDDPAARTLYVDGAPQVADAWLYSTATVAAQTAADWRTVLTGGLREGGRHYYALDVTNPSNDASAPAGNLPYPGLLWEFPNENDFNSGSGDYVNMGETWGQPVIVRVKLNVGASTNGGAGFERWVAIVTGGYDVTSDPNDTAVDPTAGEYVSSNCATTVNPSTATTNPTAAAVAPSCQGRAIYMLDLKTGKVIAQQKMGFNGDADAATTPENGLLYSLVSTPAVLDIDADGYADVVYVGDLRGNVWKWVIHTAGEDRVNDASGVRTQPAWKFQHFFQAPKKTISGTDYYRNIFQPPAAAYIGNTLWITFGTGERAAIGFKGVSGDENNRYYAINDPDPLATAAGTPAIVTEPPTSGSCAAGYTCAITDITSSGTPGARGYFFKTADGEKFVTTSVIFAGKVITASFTPSLLAFGDPGFDPCTQRGSGNLYKFDLATGVGDFEDASNNPVRYTNIGEGLPTDPKISIGVGGSDNKIVIQKSGTDIEILDTEDVDFGRGIIYWRERK